jgi:PIN domain nuclease of toxin-antitoxin system
MRLLLDSHILLWWDSDLNRLSEAQREAIGDPGNEVFVSAVTAWELGIKQATGKLSLHDSIPSIAIRLSFFELPVTMQHGVEAATLPPLHRDPFDRMLVAQAKVEGMVLVTSDRRLSGYPIATLQV